MPPPQQASKIQQASVVRWPSKTGLQSLHLMARPSRCVDGHGLQALARLRCATGYVEKLLGCVLLHLHCKACTTAALNYIDVAKGIASIYSSGMPQAVELLRLHIKTKGAVGLRQRH